MKRKGLFITVVVIGAAVLLLGVAIFLRRNQTTVSNVENVEDSKVTYGIVKVSEEVSDTEESSYRVSATLPCTDFSLVGSVLTDKLTKEWKSFDHMTKEQQLLSSKLWGVVDIQTDTWGKAEEIIGFDIDNPLETFGWLNKTGYFGMESTDLNNPVSHVQITANAAQTTHRKLGEINVTAGYSKDSVRITLTATLSANAGTYTTGSVCNGYATFQQDMVTTGTGIPVLIVITNEKNNTGYYNGDYFDPTAYWVKDNVFYTLRVLGDETDQAEIQGVLDRILGEI